MSDDNTEGRDGRDTGISRAMRRYPEHVAFAWTFIYSRRRGTRFTSEDIIAACRAAGLPEPHHWKFLGLLTHAHKNGVVEMVGFLQALRSVRHCGDVRIWKKL